MSYRYSMIVLLFSLSSVISCAHAQQDAKQPAPNPAQPAKPEVKPAKPDKPKPKQPKPKRVNLGQFKRIHQDALKMIENGKAEQAVEFLGRAAEKLPEDPETQFMLTVALAQTGDTDAAVAAMKKAIELGMHPTRFIAGPRDLLKPIHESDAYRRIAGQTTNTLVNGPMLGQVTDTEAAIWVRASAETVLRGSVSAGDADAPTRTVDVQIKKDRDFTGVFKFTGLKPNTTYTYSLVKPLGGDLKNVRELETGTFSTLPAPGSGHKFTLAFGGGAGFVPQHEHVWTTIHKQKPDALFLLGDNVYIDLPQSEYMQRYCYYRRYARPEWRKLVSSTPVYTIWDDHDFATNDSWGGPEIDQPVWKRRVYEIYRENWVNPYYGGGDDQPGCWHDFYIGDVHFIMLDGRYYRTDPRIENPSMLGPAQKKWLFETLAKSKGTFKVLCSPVPWTFVAKGDSRDTWNGFKDERNEIFDYLSDNKVEGVVLMSADRHRSDLWRIERENGYALYEFNSSRLTNQHVHGTMKTAIFSYNKKQSFGLVTFDTTAKIPTVRYQVMSIDGELVNEILLSRDQLK